MCLLEDLPQGLLQPPRPGSLQVAALQPVHQIDLFTRPPAGILEQRPAAAFQVRLVLGLRPSHLVQSLAGQGHYVERVKADARVWALACGTGLEAGGHVDGNVGDRRRVASVVAQVVGEGSKRSGSAPRRGEQQPPGIRIVKQGQVTLAAPAAGLVDRDAGDVGMAFLRACFGDVVPEHAPDAVIGHPDQPCHVGHRHRLAQGDHERFHHHREPGSVACPRHLHLGRLAACITGHPRQAGVDERAELEEVQVLPLALKAVVDRLVRRPASRARQPLGLALHLEVDGAFGLPEINRGDGPGCGQAQGLGEELFHPEKAAALRCVRQASSTQIATEPFFIAVTKISN